MNARTRVVLASSIAVLALSARVYAGEAAIAMPNGVSAFEIGRHVTINGMPTQMRGFVSALGQREVADAFRQALGRPLVENSIGGKLILGRMQGDDYVSVQIEAVGAGSRGVVAVTQPKVAYDNRAAMRASTEHWLARLPAGSRLVSQMESQDGGNSSRHLVITNAQSEALNRDRLVSLLGDEGLRLEREGVPEGRAPRRMPEGFADSRTLFFKGAHKDAIATVHREASGRTMVVLNITTSLERMR